MTHTYNTYSFNTGCQTQPSNIKLTATIGLVLVYTVLVYVFIQHIYYKIGII